MKVKQRWFIECFGVGWVQCYSCRAFFKYGYAIHKNKCPKCKTGSNVRKPILPAGIVERATTVEEFRQKLKDKLGLARGHVDALQDVLNIVDRDIEDRGIID